MLASASPRRLALLARLGVTPVAVDAADVDERARGGEAAGVFAARMARAKAAVVAARWPQAVVLAADTVVACGRRLLGKPADVDEARAYLTLLAGRRHRVFTGVCVAAPGAAARARLSATMVQFRPLGAGEIEAVLALGEWRGKAGAYAIQGHGEALVKRLDGSHSGVMGLPLAETRLLLRAAGVAVA